MISQDWIILGSFIFAIIMFWRRKSKKTYSLFDSEEVQVRLSTDLKNLGDSLFSTLQAGKGFNDPNLTGVRFESLARHYISMLQLRAVANIVREKGYIRGGPQNLLTFLEITYALLTENPPEAFNNELENLPFALAQSTEVALDLWAKSIASTASSRDHLNELLAGLKSIASKVIIEAKVKACQAFEGL